MDKVSQYIKIAQDIYIQELLGSRLYEKIQADILASSLTGDYLDLVREYIRPILAQYAFLEFLPFSQYTIGNKGVFKHSSENSEIPSPEEINKMQAATRDTAQHYSKRLVDYLCAYPTKFPEYLTNNNDDIRPTKDITFGGWHL
jgi:hypothetical protein